MIRSFRDLVPRTASLRQRLRKVLSGGTIIGVGLVSGSAAEADAGPVLPDTPAFTIANRSEKAHKLILKLPSGLSYRLLQHRSHSSHKSHSSHYSGSGGTSTPAPVRTTPRPVPAYPVRPAAELAPPVPDAEALPFFKGVIDAVDKVARTLTVRETDTKQKHTVSYRDDTNIRSLAGELSRLDDAVEKNHGAVPFEKGQKVEVHWKAGPTGKNLASTIARIN